MKNPYVIAGGLVIIAALGVFALQTTTPSNSTPTPTDTPSGNDPLPTPTPAPTPQPTPTPTAAEKCDSQVAAAQASTQGKMCAQMISQMKCPGLSTYIYNARNSCESSYLVGVEWTVMTQSQPMY